MAGGDLRFSCATTYAVREGGDGQDEDEYRDPVLVERPFKLDARYSPSASVMFRLSLPIPRPRPVAAGASSDTVVYVQLTPARIDSLRHMTCDNNDTSHHRPPCLDDVHQALGRRRFVTRLQFRLHGGMRAQLITPAGFHLDHHGLDDTARRIFAAATTLAGATRFSLYFPQNMLPLRSFRTFAHAVRQYPSLTAAQKQAHELMVDLRRLYSGKGGVEFHPGEEHGSRAPPGDDAGCSTATTESEADTVPVDTPPRYRDALARDSEEPAHDSPAGSGALPRYEDSPQPQQGPSSVARKLGLDYGSDEADVQPTPKRRRAEKVPAPTGDTQQPEEAGPSRPGEGAPPDSWVYMRFEQQRLLIESLAAAMQDLQRRNTALEGQYRQLDGRYKRLERRCNQLEENQSELEVRQADTDEAVELLEVRAGELDETCADLGRQMPHVDDEAERWVDDHMAAAVQSHMDDWLEENLSSSLQAFLRQEVAEQLALIKARMRGALE